MFGTRKRSVGTQTSVMWKDVERLRERAIKAEIVLLTMKKRQYLSELRQQQELMEQQISERTNDCLKKKDFVALRIAADQLEEWTKDHDLKIANVEEIFDYNVSCLKKGYELLDLPGIDSGLPAAQLKHQPFSQNAYDDMSIEESSALAPAAVSSVQVCPPVTEPDGRGDVFQSMNQRFGYSEQDIQAIMSAACDEDIDDYAHSQPSSLSSADPMVHAIGHSEERFDPGSLNYLLSPRSDYSGRSSEIISSPTDHYSIDLEYPFLMFPVDDLASSDEFQVVTKKSRKLSPRSTEDYETCVKDLMKRHGKTKTEILEVMQVVRKNRGLELNAKVSDVKHEMEKILAAKPGARSALKTPASGVARSQTTPKHKEPCGDQFCADNLAFLKRRTQLCAYGSMCGQHICFYAHRKNELLPLPKREICKRYERGDCRFCKEECIFAHGENDLCEEAKLTYLDLPSSTDFESTVIRKPRVANKVSTKNTQPLPRKPKKGVSLIQNADQSSSCPDCFRPLMGSEKPLPCSHQFHKECIKRRVTSGMNCPMCWSLLITRRAA